MKQTKYTGLFISAEGHEFKLTCNAFGFIQAFILLTAEAIKQGSHYQLSSIIDDKGNIREIDDINKLGILIKQTKL